MEGKSSGLKLLLSYEVEDTKLQAYQQFVMQQYVPAMQMMGFQVSEVWHTAYGEAPNRLVGFVCRDRQTLDDLLENEMWLTLNNQLEQYVTDFSYKAVPYQRGVFQM
ncbi:MAG: hypothetical protein KC433_27865 [Anaerolineales bacterium]|nr:hypothetical protein [Anaerolineales bacterium]MCB8938909.1 hypothetical protein [Ardenticatenaceae bacterium]